jgi:hypothetical protein
MDEAIQEIFQMIKHWFEYKVPKWLSVINEIVRFIYLFGKGYTRTELFILFESY